MLASPLSQGHVPAPALDLKRGIQQFAIHFLPRLAFQRFLHLLFIAERGELPVVQQLGGLLQSAEVNLNRQGKASLIIGPGDPQIPGYQGSELTAALIQRDIHLPLDDDDLDETVGSKLHQQRGAGHRRGHRRRAHLGPSQLFGNLQQNDPLLQIDGLGRGIHAEDGIGPHPGERFVGKPEFCPRLRAGGNGRPATDSVTHFCRNRAGFHRQDLHIVDHPGKLRFAQRGRSSGASGKAGQAEDQSKRRLHDGCISYFKTGSGPLPRHPHWRLRNQRHSHSIH